MAITYSILGEIEGVEAATIAEAKLCIKELRLKKKEVQLRKKEVTARIAAVRATHRTTNVRRGPAMRGSGFLAQASRGLDRATKHGNDVSTDNAVRELEGHKIRVDAILVQYDNAILNLEHYVLGGVD